MKNKKLHHDEDGDDGKGHMFQYQSTENNLKLLHVLMYHSKFSKNQHSLGSVKSKIKIGGSFTWHSVFVGLRPPKSTIIAFYWTVL